MKKAKVKAAPHKNPKSARGVNKGLVVLRIGKSDGFDYRLMALVRKKKAGRGNPLKWVCIAIGTRRLRDIFKD